MNETRQAIEGLRPRRWWGPLPRASSCSSSAQPRRLQRPVDALRVWPCCGGSRWDLGRHGVPWIVGPACARRTPTWRCHLAAVQVLSAPALVQAVSAADTELLGGLREAGSSDRAEEDRWESSTFFVVSPPVPGCAPAPGAGAAAAEADQHYVRLWVVEMMLKDGRKLFDAYTPAVHAAVGFVAGQQEQTFSTVAGPPSLPGLEKLEGRDPWAPRPDRGWLPYRGGQVELGVGLWRLQARRNGVVDALTRPAGPALCAAEAARRGHAAEGGGAGAGGHPAARRGGEQARFVELFRALRGRGDGRGRARRGGLPGGGARRGAPGELSVVGSACTAAASP
ncbi:MAG: hypothetical protein R3F43_28255 [bacterium]